MPTSAEGPVSLAEPADRPADGGAVACEPVGAGDRGAARRFRPELVPTLALVVVLALTLSAGRWQLDRAAYKLGLQQRIDAASTAPPVSVPLASVGDAAALAWHPIEAVGRFDATRVVLLDNRLRDGVPGYEVLTPLQPAGGGPALLVNRGWIAAPLRRDQLPQIDTPAGEVRVAGLGFVPGTRFMELRADTDDAARWQNWTIERARARWGIELLPLAMLQTGEAVPVATAAGARPARDGLARVWPRPDAGIDKHRGYALQWFSFAVIAVVVWLVLSLRRSGRREPPNVARVS